LRASRSEAIRHLALRWGLSLEKILVVASQQGDAELLRGLIASVVPAGHDPSLEGFRHLQRVFFASKPQVSGLLDGMNHYRFL
jgi:sucrose-phosphate synthase